MSKDSRDPDFETEGDDLKIQHAPKKQKLSHLASGKTENERGSPKTSEEPYGCGRHGLGRAEIKRYSRHLLAPDFGAIKQAKLKAASVLVVGAGGLGSAVIPLLAGSGLGKLGVIDSDVVEISNLHRQTLYRECMEGEPKAEMACVEAAKLNSELTAVPVCERFSSDNGLRRVGEYDLVVDATDNVYSRYLINDACVIAGKPLVSGSAIGFEGQLTVYCYEGGPCYRCIFGKPDPLESQRTCSDSGVIGTVPSTIGCMQATEAIKIITGFGKPLAGKLLTYDASDCSFYTIKLKGPSKTCAVCGQNPSITSLKQSVECLEQWGLSACTVAPVIECSPEHFVSCQQYHKEFRAIQQDHVLLDVRSKVQFEICSLPGSVNIPFSELAKRIPEVEDLAASEGKGGEQTTKDVYVLCRRGNDSRRATSLLLKESHLKKVFNITGGLTAWVKEVDSHFPMY